MQTIWNWLWQPTQVSNIWWLWVTIILLAGTFLGFPSRKK